MFLIYYFSGLFQSVFAKGPHYQNEKITPMSREYPTMTFYPFMSFSVGNMRYFVFPFIYLDGNSGKKRKFSLWDCICGRKAAGNIGNFLPMTAVKKWR
jgi:hypothetical protein